MVRTLILSILLLCLTVAMPATAAERRVALLIGNTTYTNAPLANPGNDVRAMHAALTAAGFDVVEARFDLNREAMTNALEEFEQKANGADIALVYFSGHGMEIDGVNYLVPIGAKLSTDRSVKYEAIALEEVLSTLVGASRLKLVLLDACRENPYLAAMKRVVTKGALSKGMGRTEPTSSNTLIAYATAPGRVALDGDGSNSPFTAALVKHLVTPGLDIRLALGRIRDDVIEATKGQGRPQEPYQTGSLGGDPIILGPKTADTPIPSSNAADADAATRVDFTNARTIGTEAGWTAFLTRHPDGLLADAARVELAALVKAKPPVEPVAPVVALVPPPVAVQTPPITQTQVPPVATPSDVPRPTEIVRNPLLENSTDSQFLDGRLSGCTRVERSSRKSHLENASALLERAFLYQENVMGKTCEAIIEAAENVYSGLQSNEIDYVKAITEDWLKWSPDFRVALQARFKQDKLYSGKTDGRSTPQWIAAVKKLATRKPGDPTDLSWVDDPGVPLQIQKPSPEYPGVGTVKNDGTRTVSMVPQWERPMLGETGQPNTACVLQPYQSAFESIGMGDTDADTIAMRALQLTAQKSCSADPAGIAAMVKLLKSGDTVLLTDLTSNWKGWSLDIRTSLQKALKGEGLYNGKTDGNASPQWTAALKALATKPVKLGKKK